MDRLVLCVKYHTMLEIINMLTIDKFNDEEEFTQDKHDNYINSSAKIMYKVYGEDKEYLE